MARQVSYGTRLSELAAQRGHEICLRWLPAGLETEVREVSFRQLDGLVNQAARALASFGVGPGVMVALALPATVMHPVLTFGAWRLGATVLPLNAAMSLEERRHVLAAAGTERPVVSVGTDDTFDCVVEPYATDLAPWSPEAVESRTPSPALAIASGGTSGAPKVIVDHAPGALALVEDKPALPPLLAAMGGRLGQVRLVCTPLHHINAFSLLTTSLALGDRVVLAERFDAERLIRELEHSRINQLIVVPTVLQRLIEAPSFEATDLSSIEGIGYGGSHCPAWVTHRWIDRIGAHRLYAGYGATEAIGKTVLRADEWLQRPGSSGRPVNAEVRILDEQQTELPAGEIGEIYMRPIGAEKPAFHYLGADYRGVTPEGFVSLGDQGWLDADGYLFVADRRTDLIITGGANVYPAEVEAVLIEHPSVVQAAVIGLPDQEWGQRVHAIVQLSTEVDEADLARWCADRLVPYKRPKTFEVMDEIPLTEIGKVAKALLIQQRTKGPSS